MAILLSKGKRRKNLFWREKGQPNEIKCEKPWKQSNARRQNNFNSSWKYLAFKPKQKDQRGAWFSEAIVGVNEDEIPRKWKWKKWIKHDNSIEKQRRKTETNFISFTKEQYPFERTAFIHAKGVSTAEGKGTISRTTERIWGWNEDDHR